MRRHCPRRDTVKSAGEIMEILEAFDLTECYRDAGELAGCSHHTVARYGETHEDCPRNAVRASRRNARVAVSVVGYMADSDDCRAGG